MKIVKVISDFDEHEIENVSGKIVTLWRIEILPKRDVADFSVVCLIRDGDLKNTFMVPLKILPNGDLGENRDISLLSGKRLFIRIRPRKMESEGIPIAISYTTN